MENVRCFRISNYTRFPLFFPLFEATFERFQGAERLSFHAASCKNTCGDLIEHAQMTALHAGNEVTCFLHTKECMFPAGGIIFQLMERSILTAARHLQRQ